MWFKFTATSDTDAVFIYNYINGIDVDSAFVYKGNCGGLNLVASSKNENEYGFFTGEGLQKDTTYWIRTRRPPSFTGSTIIIISVSGPLYRSQPFILGNRSVCSSGTYTYCVQNPGGLNYFWQITGGTPSTGSGTCIDITWDTNDLPGTIAVYGTFGTSFSRPITKRVSINTTACCTPVFGTPDVVCNYFTATEFIANQNGGSNILSSSNSVFFPGDFYVDTTFYIANSDSIYFGTDAEVLIDHDSLIFDNSTVAAGCGAMWQGIVVKNDGYVGSLLNGVDITQAKLAIHSKNGGEIWLKKSAFRNNYKSIRLDTFNGIHPIYLNPVSFFYDTLIAPYAGLTPPKAIEIDNVDSVTLDGVNFFCGDTAIDIYNSSVGIYNSTINGRATTCNQIISIGINIHTTYTYYVADSTPRYNISIGDINKGNTFDSLLTAVMVNALNAKTLNINYNTILLMDSSEAFSSGIWFRRLRGRFSGRVAAVDFSNTKINHNTFNFYDGGQAIVGGGIRNNKIEINNNNFIADSLDTKGNNAVILLSTSSNLYAENIFNINNNTMTYLRGGAVIELYGLGRCTITSNDIKTVRDDAGILIGTGVHLVNMKNSKVSCNEITVVDGSMPYSYNPGIELEASGGSTVSCNSVTGADDGFVFNGPNFLTAFVANTMTDNNIGLILENNAVIDSQGYYSVADNDYILHNNQWYSNSIATRTDNSDGTLSPFTVQKDVTGVYLPSPNQGLFGLPPIPFEDTTSNITVTCIGGSICTAIFGHPVRPPLPPRVAGGVVTSIDSLLYNWWARRDMFSYLLANDSLITQDSIVEAFYNAYLDSMPNRLDSIKYDVAAMEIGYWTEAEIDALEDRLDAISPNNTPEENEKQYLAHLMALYQGSSLSSRWAEIWAIAEQCVFYGGPAVLEARSLLMADSVELRGYAWADSCTPPTPKWSGSQYVTVETESQAPEADYSLNPNYYMGEYTGTITLGTQEHGHIEVYDLAGRQIARYTLTAGQNTVQITELSGLNGIFIYKVYANGAIKKVDKILGVW